MRKIDILLAVAILYAAIFGAGTVYGQSAPSPLRFDDQTWDFGTIRETKGKVSHRFEFTNTGTVPVVIEGVDVSCGCTSPSFSRAPVMPGKKGGIDITYDPANRPGVFLKEITVTSNNGRNTNSIKIKGTVIPRPRTVEDDYPFEVQQGIRMTAAYVNFDHVGQGQAKSMTIGYVNTSRKDADLKIVPAEAHPWFSVTSPGKVCAGCKGDITLTVDLTHATAWGVLDAGADILINGVKNGNGLTVSAMAVDNFDETAIATGARAKFDAQFFHFGDVPNSDKPLSHEFTLENSGGAPLIIRAVQCGEGATTTIREGAIIAPGATVRFTVSISLQPEGPIAGRVARSVTLVVNDPIRPIREIRLVANIKQ